MSHCLISSASDLADDHCHWNLIAVVKACCLDLEGLQTVDILVAPQDLAKQYATCLDDDQMVAMLACLRQQLTLIQGPPGTGET